MLGVSDTALHSGASSFVTLQRLRRVMMGHENFDDMQARYVQVKASGDDMDDPKLYVDSKPGRPPK